MFVSNTKCMDHMNVYIGPKPFICRGCGNAYSGRYKKARQKDAVPGKKSESCRYCSLPLKSTTAMKVHIKPNICGSPTHVNVPMFSYTRVRLLDTRWTKIIKPNRGPYMNLYFRPSNLSLPEAEPCKLDIKNTRFISSSIFSLLKLATSFKKCNVIMSKGTCHEKDKLYQATCNNAVNMRGTKM